MRDACSACDAPLDVLSMDVGRRLKYDWPKRLRCRRCQRPFDECAHLPIDRHERALRFLTVQNHRALNEGWASVGDKLFYGQAWFSGLHAICQFLCNEPVAVRLQGILGVDYAAVQASPRRFDASVVSRRISVLTAAALLIHDWPHPFRETFHHLNLTRWDMQCLNDCTPFWLHEELALLHNRRLRRLTEDEVVSTFIALRRQYQRTPSMLALANTLGYGSFPRSLVSMYRDLCNRST